MKYLLIIISILLLLSCYTKKDIDKAYEAGCYDGAIYTYYNKDSVLPSMWHRQMMNRFYNEKVDWTNTYWHNTNHFWDSVENKHLASSRKYLDSISKEYDNNLYKGPSN